MQFTDEVQWGPGDFLVMGALLFGTGLAFEWVLRRPGSGLLRIAAGLGLCSTLLMTWANLAVGLVGGEDNPANAALLVVPVVGLAGSVLARLRPRGMALTLAMMAGVHATITALALASGWKPLRQGPEDVWAPNALFILLYLASAVLFWETSSETTSPAARTLRAAALLLIGGVIGTAGVYVGATDDAPGATLVGAVVMVGAAALAFRMWQRHRD
ncbi:MAG: hypothetical protein M3Z20_00175, partial [Chloroflexota bacterium]|nr:hypothetical protein [Chloroflexota bacterium]